jgi:3-hydroxyisobutyrate dehydrogenase
LANREVVVADQTAVAVLGMGLMGSGMARSLARAGLQVTVWNRSRDKATAVAEGAEGIRVAEDPEAAVPGARVVVTMLFDADSVREVMARALPAMTESVWLQTSTVGIEGAAVLSRMAQQHGIGMVDAPVLGTRQPAEKGQLTVLASGPEPVRDTVKPVLDAIGARTVWVGEEPGEGQRLKLVANSWVLSVNAATAQAVALASGLNLRPQQFFELISGGPMDCAYAQLKGGTMIEGRFPAAFPISGAAKDAGLIVEALEAAKTDQRLMRAQQELYRAAADAGHADEDMAAIIEAFRS